MLRIIALLLGRNCFNSNQVYDMPRRALRIVSNICPI